jgi:hypothetical protein
VPVTSAQSGPGGLDALTIAFSRKSMSFCLAKARKTPSPCIPRTCYYTYTCLACFPDFPDHKPNSKFTNNLQVSTHKPESDPRCLFRHNGVDSAFSPSVHCSRRPDPLVIHHDLRTSTVAQHRRQSRSQPQRSASSLSKADHPLPSLVSIASLRHTQTQLDPGD